MKNSKLVNKITNAYVMLIYVFVFIPVIVMIAFSFNSLPSNQHWESFTLDYYSKLFSDSEMIQVLINSLTLAVISTLALSLSAPLVHMRFAGLNSRAVRF